MKSAGVKGKLKSYLAAENDRKKRGKKHEKEKRKVLLQNIAIPNDVPAVFLFVFKFRTLKVVYVLLGLSSFSSPNVVMNPPHNINTK